MAPYEFLEWNRTGRIAFRKGAFQLLSDATTIMNNKYSNGNRKPKRYIWNATITIQQNRNMVFMHEILQRLTLSLKSVGNWIACSKPVIETLEKDAKYVQS